jgi:predicted dehydrogenase
MLSRRTFLKAAAAATVVPAATSRTVRAAPGDRLTLGIIGVGTMGARHHLKLLLGRSDVEVVAVCDVVAERVESAVAQVQEKYADRKASGNFTGVKTYGDFRKLLEQPGLDAVLIATPDHWHTIPCLLAARAGKHIYCEKPLTHNIAEGRRIVDEVRKANVVFQTGSQQRSEFRGHFRKAVEYVWNGRIGQLKKIRIFVGGPPKPCDLPAQEKPEGTDWEMWTGPAPLRDYNDALCPRGVHTHFPAWRNYQEYAGGGLADMGAHHFDIAQWALGMDASGPVEVLPPENREQEHGLRFVYANGVVMYHNEFEGDAKADCVFEGTDGMILVSRSGISSRPESILNEPLGDNARRVIPSDNHHENWIAAIRAGKETICPAEIGHRSATICHLANIGYRLKRPLKWDPKLETFPNDAEASALVSRQPRGEWGNV